ncbi:LacI family DNA-binding transcriptional regulator [Leadbettera azotonutricia]|uniref:Catabolite control protein A n=1 Tax=Leadbettera azotonutricia (strain ATCC BAA-888 / DSM 13862 / ZAS-9) TaxID=545695 RepID=F5Y8A2_LEAAZ|nr:LacI family DNA-binding transcriptional regulator [Leadbettera azotonutricia]AEF82335.1 catabolite control protein A [Leadbettera azotonutricia ZAS-9]
MPGMRDVARHAKVALSTVSAVLSNSDKYVSDDVRKQVYAAAKDLGYIFTEKKRSSQKTIAVVLPIITSSFFSNVLTGIEDTISKDKNYLLFFNSNYSFEKEQMLLKTLHKQFLTGVIVDSICPSDLESNYYSWLEKEFISKNIPVLILERKLESEKFYTIYLDNFTSAQKATQHLIDLGHKKIAHILGNSHMQHSFERLEGYKHALIENGIPIDPELIQQGDFTAASGYLATRKLLDIRRDFTAIFSANDQMAIGAIKALRANGKNIPKDCAIVGFDNLSISTLIDPALSTINVPTFLMGRMAARIIMETSSGGSYPHSNKLDSNLIIRRSSDINAINEWDLIGW